MIEWVSRSCGACMQQGVIAFADFAGCLPAIRGFGWGLLARFGLLSGRSLCMAHGSCANDDMHTVRDRLTGAWGTGGPCRGCLPSDISGRIRQSDRIRMRLSPPPSMVRPIFGHRVDLINVGSRLAPFPMCRCGVDFSTMCFRMHPIPPLDHSPDRSANF